MFEIRKDLVSCTLTWIAPYLARITYIKSKREHLINSNLYSLTSPYGVADRVILSLAQHQISDCALPPLYRSLSPQWNLEEIKYKMACQYDLRWLFREHCFSFEQTCHLKNHIDMPLILDLFQFHCGGAVTCTECMQVRYLVLCSRTKLPISHTYWRS